MSLECAWEHWCCGDPPGQYGPFRFLQWHDFSDSKKRKRLSHYRCMMMEVQTRAMANFYWYERPTVEQARAMLVNVLPELPISDVTAKNRQRRKQQLKWSSVLQEIRENRRRVNN
ncbi:hypothetical protein PPTG_21486 [Phytophthora nicotianae INRA-310]|uniref:Uncharacterized protein n=1 Tax=Phytophthora nicotianae (strain INRA-310) TaxID=761204 RepID=W2R3A3_PHYN3|nr:hypothetical protein PPTG_21486 [Phytophthora nicotianae INRA-310]ETN19736.1 hypothetical protein PPTG_21486 [Phytophthora nicotianae INRA-310]